MKITVSRGEAVSVSNSGLTLGFDGKHATAARRSGLVKLEAQDVITLNLDGTKTNVLHAIHKDSCVYTLETDAPTTVVLL